MLDALSLRCNEETPRADLTSRRLRLRRARRPHALGYSALAVPATTGYGLGQIGRWLFGHLDIVRVYTEAPGRPPDRHRPFILHRGQTVEDVARLVHKDLVQSLKYARVWGKTAFDRQHVGREHPVGEGDVVALHV